MKTRLLLLAAVALGLASGCGSQSAREPGSQAPLPASERTGSAGVTVELPTGWHATTWNDGNVIDPITRIVVASAPVQPKDSACQVAQYEFRGRRGRARGPRVAGAVADASGAARTLHQPRATHAAVAGNRVLR
jgi:hypothetical protein